MPVATTPVAALDAGDLELVTYALDVCNVEGTEWTEDDCADVSRRLNDQQSSDLVVVPLSQEAGSLALTAIEQFVIHLREEFPTEDGRSLKLAEAMATLFSDQLERDTDAFTEFLREQASVVMEGWPRDPMASLAAFQKRQGELRAVRGLTLRMLELLERVVQTLDNFEGRVSELEANHG